MVTLDTASGKAPESCEGFVLSPAGVAVLVVEAEDAHLAVDRACFVGYRHRLAEWVGVVRSGLEFSPTAVREAFEAIVKFHLGSL
jgi:hypothetical protein